MDTLLKYVLALTNRLVGLFRRTYVHITADIFKIFYKVFIRPKLEYACHIWSPYLVKDVLKLEKVQRRATKCVKSLAKLPYRERMRALGLICLENRRKRADLTLMWKFINGDVYIKFKHPPILRPVGSKCRGHSFTLIHPSDRPPKSKLRTNFFTERIIRLWNGLPESTVSAPSLSTFKGRLDSFWSSEHNLPPCHCDKPNDFCIPLS